MHSTINTNTTLTNRDLDGTKVQMTNSESHCIKQTITHVNVVVLNVHILNYCYSVCYYESNHTNRNVRGIMSFNLCLSTFLLVTDCDIAIICANRHKPSSLSYINSVDARYHCVSTTNILNDYFNLTHGKGDIYIIYIVKFCK